MKIQYKSLLLASVLTAFGAISPNAMANENFIGEVRFVGFNFAPRGWASCDGQLLPIADNTALFSILGTMYGGDGRTTFALPDMRGRTPVHKGNGPGLSPYREGQKAGAENKQLTVNHLPAHSHTLNATTSSARTSDAAGNALGRTRSNLRIYDSSAANIALHGDTVSNAGSTAVSNMQPSLTLKCIIATQGVYPSRS